MNQLIHFKIVIVLLFKRFEIFPIQAFLDFQLYENKDSLNCVLQLFLYYYEYFIFFLFTTIAILYTCS